MIIGAHTVVYSKAPEADRTFLRDVLELTSVDVGGGWLIFGLPPTEIAVHPSNRNNVHELYFMCEDLAAFVSRMKENHIPCSAVLSEDWGSLTHITLPGGGQIGVYEPHHARPEPVGLPNAGGTGGKRGAPRSRGRSGKR